MFHYTGGQPGIAQPAPAAPTETPTVSQGTTMAPPIGSTVGTTTAPPTGSTMPPSGSPAPTVVTTMGPTGGGEGFSGKQEGHLSGLLFLKGDLDGTILPTICLMRFLERALLASCKNRTQLSPLNIAYTYDSRRILKHVLKSYDIFRVVCVCRKDVVG